MSIKNCLQALGLSSRGELAEEVVKARRAAVCEFRNDEGSISDIRFYEFWERYNKLEGCAKEMNLSFTEIEEARKRLERGIPVGTYGEYNIFSYWIEWLNRIMSSGRPHLKAAEECIAGWADDFRDRANVPINDRIQMVLNCRYIIASWRKEVGIVSFYPLFRAIQNSVELARVQNDHADMQLVEQALELVDENYRKKERNPELEDSLILFNQTQGSRRLILIDVGEIEESLSRAEKLRSIETCDKVRVAVNEVIPDGKNHLQERFQVTRCLIEPVQRLIRLALDCGSERLAQGDLNQAQEFWVLALSASEILKSSATGDYSLLINRVGEALRHHWPQLMAQPFLDAKNVKPRILPTEIEDERRQCRLASSELFSKWSHWQPRDVGQIIGRDEGFMGPCAKPSFKNFVVLSYCLLGNDLIAFLDGEIGRFMYGDGFRDYEYTPDKVRPNPLICSPFVKVGVRQQIIQTTQRLHDLASRQALGSSSFLEAMNHLSELLAVREVDEALANYCAKIDIPKEDMCLIIIPDGPLHRIPFSFLRSQHDRPLFQRFAAISTALSLLSLKWQLMSYLWRCLPFIPSRQPRCLFIGVPSTEIDPDAPYLSGVKQEWKKLLATFGERWLLAFGDTQSEFERATIDNVATYHRDAEIFWFAGHGLEQEGSHVTIGGLELPRIGLVLPGEVLTSDMLYLGGPWNFCSSWIVVLNACLIGRLYERGTEMMGLTTGLYLAGATSVVTCLWPVKDELASQFAEIFSGFLLKAYTDKDRREMEFVRSKAFAETLRVLARRYSEADLACYFYSGVP